MYCGFDRFTYRQMSDVNSTLSKSGREICSAYENAIGKPFYYFLYHHPSKKERKTCPDCGGEWRLDEDIGNLSFKCDECRLVS
jgi:predicted  nucleic acid-binding Zn ribbon protein